ncbi:LysR substrate-binding domain-containing protein [Piscinibacter sakaiensis]|uniref:LysR substrate-binding domain-containing protein n=1 Tax=Piscinibacter sakaiensis TaxID=1547922 RepID=UPI003AAA9226
MAVTLDPRLKLRHLQALLAISDGRSVQAAADQLSRTPSAVSKSLSELELIVGDRLFDRTRRGLLPTTCGERLLEQVQRALALLGDGLEQAGGRDGAASGTPTVTLGVLPTAASTLAPAAVRQFQIQHPNAVVRVVEGTNISLLSRLREREFDIVVGRLGDASLMFDLSFEPLYEEPLVLVAAAGHPLLDETAVSVARACEYPVILPDDNTIIRATLDPVLIGGGVSRPPRLVETLSDAFGRHLVAQGEVVWFCAPGVVEQELASGRFGVVDIDLGATRRAVGLSARSDAPLAPAAGDLAELLRIQARRLRTDPLRRPASPGRPIRIPSSSRRGR